MSMPTQTALRIAATVSNQSTGGNQATRLLIAQTEALQILQEVNEIPENYPNFDKQLQSKMTMAAYTLLSAGCSLLEKEITEGLAGLDYGMKGSVANESAAKILVRLYETKSGTDSSSRFHSLVAALAFYTAGHYSRAFVGLKRANDDGLTDVGKLLKAFLTKKHTNLPKMAFNYIIRGRPSFNHQSELDEWVITEAVALSISEALEFIHSGKPYSAEQSQRILDDALIITEVGNSPGNWWLVRLFKLVLQQLSQASLWAVLPPYYANRTLLERYIRQLSLREPPIIELWTSQREVLGHALSSENSGAIISLRTSAGKTRVAELAILKILSEDSEAKVLYLAPYRSLALEVEGTLAETFEPLGFSVSHLYGGVRVSSADAFQVEETSIIIATPEKAKGLFRSYRELFSKLKLIVVDEGHLIGYNERWIRNEVFLEQLRSYAKTVNARILLLSAVLPNTEHLATWLNGDSNSVGKSTWKPADERFGLLRWNGERVRLEWQGDIPSFNPSFVIQTDPNLNNRRRNKFPHDKVEAVAATACRLSALGPILIFTGQARSVPKQARAMLNALKQVDAKSHAWPTEAWKVFKAACVEELENGSIEMRAAEHGVICHHGKLPPLVRSATESLMRSAPPVAIIATSTLGQGVNIGVTSVIVASPYISREPIEKQAFWNICGRAGRAFVDGEGKILYAIDDTQRHTVKKNLDLAKGYFDSEITDPVVSGVLRLINHIWQNAINAHVGFDVLLELIANNDFGRLEESEDIKQGLDQLDDGLLALGQDLLDDSDDPEAFLSEIEAALRFSLCCIQADSQELDLKSEQVTSVLVARVRWIIHSVPTAEARRLIAAMALPLSKSLSLLKHRDQLTDALNAYLASTRDVVNLVELIRLFEQWTLLHAPPPDALKISDLNDLLLKWLSGVSLAKLASLNPSAKKITREFYGYYLPWILNAVARVFKDAQPEMFEAIGDAALRLELGVPTTDAALAFLAGVRSRTAASEISRSLLNLGDNVAEVRFNLSKPSIASELIKASSILSNWLPLGNADAYEEIALKPFTLRSSPDSDTLYVRIINKVATLCTLDGKWQQKVKSTLERPFLKIADSNRFVINSNDDGSWRLVDRRRSNDSS